MDSDIFRENTVDFYDKESGEYSKKRYEGKTLSYFQFLFKRRRQLFLGFIGGISKSLKDSDVLEIGCADGVLIKKLFQKLPNTFRSITGVDVSPKMLDRARETTKDYRAKYFLRGEEPIQKYDLVIELGVHTQSFEEEMFYVAEKLNLGGYFIYSVSGSQSLHAKIKLKGKDYAKDYLSYSGYENIIKKYFDVVAHESYGLFVPKLWAIPTLANLVQPMLEALFKNILPNLFHEKIYLLRKKA